MSCLGKIQSPPDGTKLIVLPGSNVKIKWSFDDDINTVLTRTWDFIYSNGSTRLALIVYDGPPKKSDNRSLNFEIEKPATLVLTNVDDRYNGTYLFILNRVDPVTVPPSEVTVLIASKFSLRGNFFQCHVFAMKSVQNVKSFSRSTQNYFVLALFSSL